MSQDRSTSVIVALELKRRGGAIGAAGRCGGGGQEDALVVRVPRS